MSIPLTIAGYRPILPTPAQGGARIFSQQLGEDKMPQLQGGKTQQQGRRNRRGIMMELDGKGLSSVQSATSAEKVGENSIHTDSTCQGTEEGW